jgi:cytochrome c biogenesis protein CcmG/thiol:disulfide interchange protein DsbE
MNRRLIPLAIFVVLLVLLGVGLHLNPREVPSPLIGKPAPDFRLPTLKDPAVTLGKQDLLGKVYLLNVWASWCVSCREEHPLLVDIAQTGLVKVYGLNYKDHPEDAQRWLTHFGNPYLGVAVDESGRTGIDYGVYGVPESYVIDKKGIVRHKYIGPLTPDKIQGHLLPLVRQLEGEG